MKRFINRRILSFFLYYSGVVPAALLIMKWKGHGAPLILVGHRVLPKNNNDASGINDMALLSSHAITDREFERRLRFIKRFRDAGDPRDLGHGNLSNRAFYLTLDDGYLDNKIVAGPILRKLRIQAIIFVVGELLRRPTLLPWWDIWGARSHLNNNAKLSVMEYMKKCGDMKRGFLGLTQHKTPVAYDEDSNGKEWYISENAARELHADGVFYIANHTQSHANLTCLPAEKIAEEILQGMAAIRDLPGYLPVLAYPFGQYDKRVLAFLESRNDIAMAFATGNGTNNSRFTVRRVNLNTRHFYLFAAECAGIFNFLKKPTLAHLKTAR